VKTFACWYLQSGHHHVPLHQPGRSKLAFTFLHFLCLEEEYTTCQKEAKLWFLAENKKEYDSKSILNVGKDDADDQLVPDFDAIPPQLPTHDAAHPPSHLPTDVVLTHFSSQPGVQKETLVPKMPEADAIPPQRPTNDADALPPQLPTNVVDATFPVIQKIFSLHNLHGMRRKVRAMMRHAVTRKVRAMMMMLATRKNTIS
jgi:hypothetical protein